MSSRRSCGSAIEDYPEHLNPFKDDDHKNQFWKQTSSKRTKRSNSFSSTLKDIPFISAIRKSFRRKNKSDKNDKKAKSNDAHSPPVLRKQENATICTGTLTSRQTIGSFQPRTPQPAYPRSRFSERLTRDHYNSDTISICSRMSSNPFEDDDDIFNRECHPSASKPPLSSRKKRAPPPPASSSRSISDWNSSAVSSLNVSMESDLNKSQDEEQSFNNRENNATFGSSSELIVQLQHLTVELQKLTDNSNISNNFTEKNSGTEGKNQEKMILHPLSHEETSVDVETSLNETETINHVTKINSERSEETENADSQLSNLQLERDDEQDLRERENNENNVQLETNSNLGDCMKGQVDNEIEEKSVTNGPTLAEPEQYEDEDSSDESISEYAESYLVNENPIYNTDKFIHNNSQLSCNYVTSDKDNMTKEIITSEPPVPKLRKNKLTKNTLLGKTNNEI